MTQLLKRSIRTHITELLDLTLSLLPPQGKFEVGDNVLLAVDYETHDDAKNGPLTFGLTDSITQRAWCKERKTVRYKVQGWWYNEDALNMACLMLYYCSRSPHRSEGIPATD